jgi:hypothetical protein
MDTSKPMNVLNGVGFIAVGVYLFLRSGSVQNTALKYMDHPTSRFISSFGKRFIRSKAYRPMVRGIGAFCVLVGLASLIWSQ